MSEDKKNQAHQKGGAHIAKAGSSISISAEKASRKKSGKGKKHRVPVIPNDNGASLDVQPGTPAEQPEKPPIVGQPEEPSPPSLEETQAVPVVFTPSATVPSVVPDAPGAEDIPHTTASSTQTTENQPYPPPKRNRYADKMNKKKSKGRKRLGTAIGLIVVTLVFAGGVYMVVKSRQATEEVDESALAYATRGTLETYVEGNGITAASKREELGKDAKGTVSEILVEVGSEVKTGDILIVLNPTETRDELAAAEQELSNAQRGVTDAQAEVRTAQEEVEAINQSLGKLDVTAPFSGKIIPVEDSDGVSKSYRVGQQVSSGEVIGYMVDDTQMKLSLYYNAAYEGDITAGQTANVSIPSTMDSLTGIVSSVDQTQRLSTEGVKLIRVTVEVTNPGTLVKGMSATATVAAGEEGEIYPTDSGVLEYSREEAVSVQSNGEITALNGIDYYTYSSGSTIMSITSEELQGSLKSAQNRVTALQNNVATAQRQVQTVQERINELKKQIADATVKATMDGVVVSMNAEVGQEGAASGALITIADLGDIIVNAEIPSADITNVEPGQPATMTSYLGDGTELTLTGTVKSVALEPDQESLTSGGTPVFPAVIEIDPVEGQSIPIGQSVEYKIITASSMDSLIVPSAAIVNTETGTAVFARPGEGETFEDALPIPEGTEGVPPDFVLVPVETGLSDSSNTEILWGIKEGTTVFLAVQDLYASMEDMG